MLPEGCRQSSFKDKIRVLSIQLMDPMLEEPIVLALISSYVSASVQVSSEPRGSSVFFFS